MVDWGEILGERFLKVGWKVETVNTVPKALGLLNQGSIYNVAIVDKGGSGKWSGQPDLIGHRDGLRVLKKLKEEQPSCIRVLATAEPWNPQAFNEPGLGVQIFYDKTSAKAHELFELTTNWTPRKDGLPHLFLRESPRHFERW